MSDDYWRHLYEDAKARCDTLSQELARCTARAEAAEAKLASVLERVRSIIFHAEGRIANRYWHPHCKELLREVKGLLPEAFGEDKP